MGGKEERGDRRTDPTLKITCIGLYGEAIGLAFHALVYGKGGNGPQTEEEQVANEATFAKAFTSALRGPDFSESERAVRALLRANEIKSAVASGELVDWVRRREDY